MKKRLCGHCGHELQEFDIYGNEGWHCPNDCAFEMACKKAEEILPFEIEAADLVRASNDTSASQEYTTPVTVKTSHCWYCKGTVFRLTQNQDPPYGHFCSICGHSLRFHPLLGQGAPHDQALRFSAHFKTDHQAGFSGHI
jgi:hypothetical protein